MEMRRAEVEIPDFRTVVIYYDRTFADDMTDLVLVTTL